MCIRDRCRIPVAPTARRSGPSPARAGLGPLGRRLLLAFVLVAVSSVLVLTVAALIGVGRGFEVAAQVDHEQAAASASTAAGDAYRQAAGWDGADLSRTSAVAEAAGARLFVLDASGSSVGGGAGGGPLGLGQGKGKGPVGGQGVVNAPVLVNGASVGTVRLVFESAAGTRARDVAWSWIAVAAVVALLVAVLASWVVTRLITRPIKAMTAATREFAAGDRQVRAGSDGPGELGELARAFDSMADTVARSERAPVPAIESKARASSPSSPGPCNPARTCRSPAANSLVAAVMALIGRVMSRVTTQLARTATRSATTAATAIHDQATSRALVPAADSNTSLTVPTLAPLTSTGAFTTPWPPTGPLPLPWPSPR